MKQQLMKSTEAIGKPLFQAARVTMALGGISQPEPIKPERIASKDFRHPRGCGPHALAIAIVLLYCHPLSADMGDVPPALLSSGTPEQVYEHCTKLVEDIGPTGYILQSGCDIPVDAPLANVKAMSDAAADAAG